MRRLAAILAADVAGYSRLMEADEAGTLAALKERRKRVLEPLVAQHQGRVFKVAGDGVLVEFASAVNAVQCAVDLQQGMAAANAGLPDDRRIVLRIGINLGDVIVEGGDLYGDGVNIAARLEAITEPGGIIVSGTAYDQVKNKIESGFDDLGPRSLKNMAEPVRAYRVAGSPHVAASAIRVATDKPSIAVLPFVNMSGDPEQEYFSDGITEDIITELSRFRSLLVIARNSSFAFKGKHVSVQEIAKVLGVAYVVEGSIRKAAARIRISAQLVEATAGTHLWAERYDRDLADIFAVQDEVSRAIVSALPVRLGEAAIERTRRLPAKSLTAYDFLLRARWAHWHTSADSREAFAWLEKAIAVDAQFAPAHALLALSYAYGIFTLGLPMDEASRQARTHAARALAIDDSDAFIHAGAAAAFSICGEHELARIHSDRAIELNPNDIYVIKGRGFVLTNSGEPSAALEWYARLLSLVPHASDDTISEDLFDCYYCLGDYEKAIETFERWRAPPFHMYVFLAAAYAQLGRSAEARSAIAEFERKRLPAYDMQNMFSAASRMTKRQVDRDRLIEGLRKAGFHL